jgi:hypothetical protein
MLKISEKAKKVSEINSDKFWKTENNKNSN